MTPETLSKIRGRIDYHREKRMLLQNELSQISAYIDADVELLIKDIEKTRK